jgi:microcystin-dependent protein
MSINFNDQLDQVSATSGILTQNNVGGFVVAAGDNVTNKPSPSGNNGLIRYNTLNNVLEAVVNGVYYNLALVPTGPTALIAGFVLKAGDTMTGALGLPPGNTSAPGLTIGGASTGIFSALSNTMSVSANGTEAIRFNADASISVNTPISLTAASTAITQPATDSSTNIATTAFVANSAVPSGTLIEFAGATAPVGYLECNGASYLTSVYPALFAAIGYIYGGAGANFNVPDCRGMFTRGWDHGAGVDAGRSLGSTQADIFSTHAHGANVNDPAHQHLTSWGEINQNGNYGHAYNNNRIGSHSTDGDNNEFYTDARQTGITVTINNTGGNETRPKNIAVMKCIKH